MRRGPEPEFARVMSGNQYLGQAGAEVESRLQPTEKKASHVLSLKATTHHKSQRTCFALRPFVIVVWCVFWLAPRWRIGPGVWEQVKSLG